MSAASVPASIASNHGAGAGSIPSAALQSLQVQPIPVAVAKGLIVQHHYLHSLPGGTCLAFGVFLNQRLLGALAFGVGPLNCYSLVDGASPDDCAVLTRLWLSDQLPHNSESRVLGVVLRSLRKHTSLKFLVSYADPSHGHMGTIYQASSWCYTGLSEAMPLYDIGDGKPRHSRSLSHTFGTHSVQHFARYGVRVKLVAQAAKHRYLYFLDSTWRERLLVPVLPYPKKEAASASG